MVIFECIAYSKQKNQKCKLIADHEEHEHAKRSRQLIDDKENLSEDVNEVQIDSFAFKKHLKDLRVGDLTCQRKELPLMTI